MKYNVTYIRMFQTYFKQNFQAKLYIVSGIDRQPGNLTIFQNARIVEMNQV